MRKIKSHKKLVNPRYAKSRSYSKVIRNIAEKGICPFCPKHFKTYHKNEILNTSGDWLITKAGWPYVNSYHHFVIIGRRHLTNINDLAADDLKEIYSLVHWALEEFKIDGGGFAMRFGNTDHTGATVSHLHAHLISPKIDATGRAIKPVLFPIG